MRSNSLPRWAGITPCFRTRPPPINLYCPRTAFRHVSTETTSQTIATEHLPPVDSAQALPSISIQTLEKLPSPPVSAARTSAKLAALHARLNLSSKIPLETLARCLVHSSADSNSRFNNASMVLLGADILAAHTSEYIISKYPRLPLIVVYAAMNAFVGDKALAAITREFGVLHAAAPGGEVDPGYLQYRHTEPAPQPEKLGPQYLPVGPITKIKDQTAVKSQRTQHRRSISNKVIYDNEFGEQEGDNFQGNLGTATLESASASFARAVVGAIYLHSGRQAAKQFYKDHVMSRQLDIATLISFRRPTQDISRLCAREAFQPPVARILSETGRASRHPVFVVGVFSGGEKLGEGAGSSVDEARTRAAVAALKAWYLYSPMDWRLPSDAGEDGKPWKPGHIDMGDVIV